MTQGLYIICLLDCWWDIKQSTGGQQGMGGLYVVYNIHTYSTYNVHHNSHVSIIFN